MPAAAAAVLALYTWLHLVVWCTVTAVVQAREQLVSQNATLEGVKVELKAAQDSKAALQVRLASHVHTSTTLLCSLKYHASTVLQHVAS